ncbi:hypothetical protein [Methanobacterium sp.]|uniref:hypothetical protein n=1 Tax=Methanobacterium sp. TaxID=2164 RepID=UPI003C74B1E7
MFSAVSTSSAAVIGSTSYGYVEKFTYGNPYSPTKIVYITGVHPMESEFSYDVANAVRARSDSLDYRYIVYKVHVTKSASDYTQGRLNGQLLAQKFVVPDVIRNRPVMTFDVHENHGASSGYRYYRFLYPISTGSYTLGIARSITYRMPILTIYTPPNPTSPQYVTGRIVNAGIPAIILESYHYDSASKKLRDARTFVNVVDNTFF